MNEKMNCHECGATMQRDVRPSTVTYKEQTLTVNQPGWYCEGCEESLLSPEDIAATEGAFLAFRAEVDGVLGPGEVRAVRKRLRLSQRRAGDLLGGGPRAFQKYEAGTASVSRPMSNLLRLLNNDPQRLTELPDK
jgi:HTH-type transcriptional regulator/antitoxin MqsA